MISPSQMIVGFHYTCYTQKEIELYLAKVLSSVKAGNFVVTKRKNGTNKNDAFRIWQKIYGIPKKTASSKF